MEQIPIWGKPQDKETKVQVLLRMNLGYVIACLVRQTRNSNTYTYNEKLTKMNQSMVGNTIQGSPPLKCKIVCLVFSLPSCL